jgi:hypothetical protein
LGFDTLKGGQRQIVCVFEDTGKRFGVEDYSMNGSTPESDLFNAFHVAMDALCLLESLGIHDDLRALENLYVSADGREIVLQNPFLFNTFWGEMFEVYLNDSLGWVDEKKVQSERLGRNVYDLLIAILALATKSKNLRYVDPGFLYKAPAIMCGVRSVKENKEYTKSLGDLLDMLNKHYPKTMIMPIEFSNKVGMQSVHRGYYQTLEKQKNLAGYTRPKPATIYDKKFAPRELASSSRIFTEYNQVPLPNSKPRNIEVSVENMDEQRTTMVPYKKQYQKGFPDSASSSGNFSSMRETKFVGVGWENLKKP